MNFFKPVSRVVCTTIQNGVLASEEVIKGKSRHAICITSVGTSYIGSKSDIEASKGIKLADGERMWFPVEPSRYDQFYIKGKANLAELF